MLCISVDRRCSRHTYGLWRLICHFFDIRFSRNWLKKYLIQRHNSRTQGCKFQLALHNYLFILYSFQCEPDSLDADYQWRIYAYKVFLDDMWGSGGTAPLIYSLCNAWGEWSTPHLRRFAVGKDLSVGDQ